MWFFFSRRISACDARLNTRIILWLNIQACQGNKYMVATDECHGTKVYHGINNIIDDYFFFFIVIQKLDSSLISDANDQAPNSVFLLSC